jgi:hypothetical protein
MARVRFIEHRGVQLLLLDFSNVSDTITALAAIEEARVEVRRQPPGSLLTLTDVRGSRFDKRIVDSIRELAAHNKPYVKAAAVVGLSGLTRVVYTALIRLTGRNIAAFDTLEEGQDYLAEQA